MQFVVPIHSKMQTRRGVKGLSLVRSFKDDVLRSRTHSEFGTSDFAEELARTSLSLLSEQISAELSEQISEEIDRRIVDQLIEESRRR